MSADAITPTSTAEAVIRGESLRMEYRGKTVLDVPKITIPAGHTYVLLGASGAGKSTLLRILGLLEKPSSGRVYFDGKPADRRSLSTRRMIAAVFQKPYLLRGTVGANVGYGLHLRGVSASERDARVAAALSRVGLDGWEERSALTLSGGEAQRVALARGLVLEPRLLLLDEPLSALDLPTRRGVRGELRRILAELPCVTVYVTHSPTEALAFGQEIAVLEGGRVSQSGPRDDLLRRPRSSYVAEFLGVNYFRGRVTAREPGGLVRVAVAGGEILVAEPGDGDEVHLVLHPHEITLALARPEGSARNVLRGEVREVIPEPPAGERVRVLVASAPPLVAEVTRNAADALGLRPGLAVYAAFKATAVASAT